MIKKMTLDALKKTSEYFAETSIGNATTGWLHQPPLNNELKREIEMNSKKKKK